MAKIFNQLTDQISQLEREIHHLEARDQADLDADQVINAA